MAEAPEEEQNDAGENQEGEKPEGGEEDLNLDTESQRKEMIKKIIKIVVLALLVIGGAASFVLIKMSQEEQTIRQLTPIGADGTVIDPEAIVDERKTEVLSESRGKANYYNITPSFVINILSEDERRHYIQFDVSIMTRDSSLFYKLEHHDPIIKSIILNVASVQSYESLATMKGREKFRAQLLEELSNKIEDLTGSAGVDEVLFTKFIME